MFKLKIAGITMEFENRKAMKIAYDEARAAGKLIEAVEADPVGPQTEAEAVQSEVAEEGFSQDFQQAAPSANVEPTSIAQEDADSLLETGSSVSRERNELPKDKYIEYLYGKTYEGDLQDLVGNSFYNDGKFNDPLIKKLEETQGSAFTKEEKEAAKDFFDGGEREFENISIAKERDLWDSKANRIDPEKQNAYEASMADYQMALNVTLDSKTFYSDNEIDASSTVDRQEQEGLRAAAIKDATDSFYRSNPSKRIPEQFDIDGMYATTIAKRRKKRIDEEFAPLNEKVSLHREGKLYSSTIDAGYSQLTAELTPDQRKYREILNRINVLNRKLKNPPSMDAKIEMQKELIELKADEKVYYEKSQEKIINTRWGKVDVGEKQTRLFDESGNQVSVGEATAFNMDTNDYTRKYGEVTRQYNNYNQDQLEQSLYRWTLNNADNEAQLNRTFDFNSEVGDANLILTNLNYNKDQDGIFRNVKVKDILKYRNLTIGRGMIADRTLVFNAALYKPETGDKATISQDFSYLNKVYDDKIDLALEKEALVNTAILNRDPGSRELNLGDYVERFVETAGEAAFGEDAMSAIGTSKRKELDVTRQLFEDAEMELTDDQKKVFERGLPMKVVEGLGSFVPAIIEFGLLNKVAGATGIARVITNLAKPLKRYTASQNLSRKILSHVYGAALEEAKFKIVTRGESKIGGGAGFYAGGKFSGLLNLGRYIGLGGQKILGGAIGGVSGSETAKVVESVVEDLRGIKDFKNSFNEYYGNTEEFLERLLVDGLVFGALGVQNLKKPDFYGRRKANEALANLGTEILEGKYKGKELTKKQNLYKAIQNQVNIFNEGFDKLNIGSQFPEAEKAREVVRTGKYKDGKVATPDELIDAKKLINRYEANVTAAQRKINRDFDAFVESGVIKGDVKLIITEGAKEGVISADKKATFDPSTKTFTIDINSYKPGVFAQEVGHAFSYAAFETNPQIFEAFRGKIESTMNSAFKGAEFTYKGTKYATYREAIDAAYKPEKGDKNMRPEEYVMNVVELLAEPANKAILAETKAFQGLRDAIMGTARSIGLPYKKGKALNTGAEVIDYLIDLGTVAESGSAKAIRNKFKEFENLIIGEKSLKTIYGENITTKKEAIKALSSAKIEPSEKKDIFAKATRVYDKAIADGDTIELTGILVGYEMAPLVRKRIRAYLAEKDLQIPEGQKEIVEDLVSDVTTSIKVLPEYNQKGELTNNPEPGTGIPTLVESYTKGANLIKYIKENPKATPAEINKKAEEFGVREVDIKGKVDLAKEGGEATMTSYVFGQLDNRILASMQKPAFSDVFRTFSLDKNPGQIENIAEGEGLGGGGISDGYVDLSSPEKNVRIKRIKAEVALKLPKEVKETINGVGERLLMATPLKNIDAKQVGSIKLPSGKTAEVVISKSERAVINVEGEPTEVMQVRSPKILEEKFKTGKKSFIKRPTTKEKLYRDAIDLIYPTLEKAVPGLKDNYNATPEYEAFIDNAFPLFKDYLSQSAVNKRFAEFKEPAIDKKTGEIIKKKTSAGGKMFQKKDVVPAEWKKYFIGDGSTRIDGRRRSIIEAFSGEFGFDSVMEALMKESLREQIESRQTDIGVKLLDNYVEILAKEIDRGNPGTMASKIIEISKKGGVDPMELLFDKEGRFRGVFSLQETELGKDVLREIELELQGIAEIQREIAERDGAVATGFKSKLKEKKISFADEFDNIKSASPKRLAEYEDFIREAISYLPAFMETSTLNSYSKTSGGLLAALFSYTGRGKVFFDKNNKKINELGAPVFREKFIGPGKFGAKELPTDIKKMWDEVETYAKENGFDSENLSISYKSRKFFDSLEKIQYEDYPGTREQKQKEIDGLEGREEAIKDITLKEKVLDAFLATMGHMAKNKKGAELKKFAISVGTMLLNNDGTGIRRYSSENYVELGINPDKTITTIDKKTGEEIVSEPGTKNEHLNSRVQFGADIVEALLQGKLTPDNIKMLTSQYLSVIGSKNGQIFTDKTLGATIENSGQLKMLVSRMFDMDLSAIDIKTLKDFYNWRTGETAYTEMIRDFTEKTIKSRLFADKGAEAAYADMAKEIDADNFVYFKDAVSTKVLSNKVIALDKAFEEGANPNKKPKGISVFDFDDTLARTKSNVLYTLPDGTKGKLNATEFAKKSEALEAKGAEFDFSEFSKVVKGELGPLFSEAQKKEGKYTNKDIFVLTARPSNSAMAIYKFLKSEGLEIPIDNIVGLGDGAAKAKAAWMVDKVSEGYNDFYFADDAIKNVEAVRDALGMFDVKSEVQQAMISASKKITLEKGLAEMIERKKGISSKETVSAAIASNLGKKKGRYDWFIPPNAEDFAGLMYKFYGKGKQGDKDMALIKNTLIRPFNRAENAISTYKQTLGNDYSALESKMGDLKVSMSKETKSSLEQANVNADQATRVFIYNKLGYKIPGLEKNEIENISRIVNGDARLSAYAEGVMGITKTKEVFPRPGETWYSSNIRYELFKYSTEGVRGHFLKDWQKNVDEMFTEENFSRIEAGYGKNYTNNLKEILARMKTGKTRSADLGKDVQAGMDYVNGSVGVIMFLNTRSAVLQTISSINYVNWSDNNPLQIGKAVAKPKEWGKTFMEIYNSDFLKQRRGGLEINVEEAEIAKAVERSKGNARNLYDSMIKIGFKPTQMADSFAIAFGGTPFLMNRTATYVKQGLSAEAAKKRAFEDFREVSEESQQSSRQDRVSNIQTGVAGRLIFAFANTPMQMSRITKKAALDLANGRGDTKTNISKMLYYGAVQSYIFYALQQSQFLRLFGGDDEDMTQEQKDFNKANNEKKNTKIANSMFDSFISGSGSPGKVAITAKNTILEYYKQKEKGYKADYGDVLNAAFSISPPLSSKSKKVYSAYKSYKHFSTKKGMKELETYGKYAFDNPMLMANAKVFSSLSNVPADRLLQKANNLYSAFTDETLTPIQSVALAAGWDKWSLGLYDPDFMTANEIAENKIKRKEQLKQEKIAKKKAALKSYNMNMSPEEKRDILKVLTKKEQIDSLWSLGLTNWEIKDIKKLKEEDRIEKIISLQNKKQFNQDMLKISTTTRQDSLK